MSGAPSGPPPPELPTDAAGAGRCMGGFGGPMGGLGGGVGAGPRGVGGREDGPPRDVVAALPAPAPPPTPPPDPVTMPRVRPGRVGLCRSPTSRVTMRSPLPARDGRLDASALLRPLRSPAPKWRPPPAPPVPGLPGRAPAPGPGDTARERAGDKGLVIPLRPPARGPAPAPTTMKSSPTLPARDVLRLPSDEARAADAAPASPPVPVWAAAA